jgi:hypothetical protein
MKIDRRPYALWLTAEDTQEIIAVEAAITTHKPEVKIRPTSLRAEYWLVAPPATLDLIEKELTHVQ